MVESIRGMVKDEEEGVCEWERCKEYGKRREVGDYGAIERWKKWVNDYLIVLSLSKKTTVHGEGMTFVPRSKGGRWPYEQNNATVVCVHNMCEMSSSS